MNLQYSLFSIKPGKTDFSTQEYQYWIILSGDGQLSSENGTVFFTSQEVLDIPFRREFSILCRNMIHVGCIELYDFQSNNTLFQKKDFRNTELIRKIWHFAMDFQGLHDPAVPGLMHHVNQMMYEALLRTGLEEYIIDPGIAAALNELNAHIYDPDYDVNSCVKKSGYSQSWFHRLFRETTGFSPLGFIRHQRIEHAEYLLGQSQELSVQEVAAQCGFQDAYYFSRVFRKSTGMSPSQYRRRKIT